MVIGIMRLTLFLPENHSLKGKRQVSRSLVQRIRNRFNVAVSEVADQDRWQQFGAMNVVGLLIGAVIGCVMFFWAVGK